MFLEQVIARWRRLVAFMKALDLLYWSMHLVLYCHIAMTIEMASKVGVFCIVVLLIAFDGCVLPWHGMHSVMSMYVACTKCVQVSLSDTCTKLVLNLYRHLQCIYVVNFSTTQIHSVQNQRFPM